MSRWDLSSSLAEYPRRRFHGRAEQVVLPWLIPVAALPAEASPCGRPEDSAGRVGGRADGAERIP